MNTAVANLVGITGITRRLVLDGALNEADARRALDESSKQKKQVQLYLLEQRLVTQTQIAAANAVEFGMPLFDTNALDLAQSAVKIIGEELLQKHHVLPLFKRGNRLYVGISDPTNTRALDEIKFAANMTVEPILVSEDVLKKSLDLALTAGDTLDSGGEEDEGLENLESSGGDEDGAPDTGVEARGDDTPVVKFVNKVLLAAIKKGAAAARSFR